MNGVMRMKKNCNFASFNKIEEIAGFQRKTIPRTRPGESEVGREKREMPFCGLINIEKSYITVIGNEIPKPNSTYMNLNNENKTPNKKINYTAIAIKGLLVDFKPRHVKIEIDGQTYEYDNVWLAPTMKGRYYGGGMMVAPGQDRLSDKLTVVVYSCKSKIKSLITFPLIFEGKHVEKKDVVKVFTGNKVHVTYDAPCAAQIDGETVLNVKEYWVEL